MYKQMFKILESKKCTKLEIFEGYRQYHMAHYGETGVFKKPIDDSLLFKALVRAGCLQNKKDLQSKKAKKWPDIGGSAALKLMRSIGAGVKISQVKAYADKKRGFLTGLQFNYVDTFSKVDSDRIIDGEEYLVNNKDAKVVMSVFEIDRGDYITGITLYYVKARCIQAIRVNTHSKKSHTFGDPRPIDNQEGNKVERDTLTPPAGAEIVCFWGAKNKYGIANLGMYVMRNADLAGAHGTELLEQDSLRTRSSFAEQGSTRSVRKSSSSTTLAEQDSMS